MLDLDFNILNREKKEYNITLKRSLETIVLVLVFLTGSLKHKLNILYFLRLSLYSFIN